MKKTGVIMATIFALAMAGEAVATTYVETGDAGQSLATAQAVSSGTTQITGSLGAAQADLFSFGWGGGSFYVNTVGTTYDSQLFLFDSAGHGIQANDDGIAFAGPAYLQLASLASGIYYLGISAYDYDPRNAANGLMFQSWPYEALYGPINASDTLDHWDGYGSLANYTINFSQTTGDGQLHDDNPTGDPSAVPEPSSFALIGIGLAGLGLVRRKMKK